MKNTSVFRKVFYLLVVSFSAILLAGLMIIRSYAEEQKRELEISAENNVQSSARYIEEVITSADTDLRETAVIAQSFEYISYIQDSDIVLARNQLHTFVSVIANVNRAIDVLFVETSQHNMDILKYSQNLKNVERIAFTDLYHKNKFPDALSWEIDEYADDFFLVKNYHYGKYRSGMAMRLSNLAGYISQSDYDHQYLICLPDGTEYLLSSNGFLGTSYIEKECPVSGTPLILKYRVSESPLKSTMSLSRILLLTVTLLCAVVVGASMLIIRRSIATPIKNLLMLTDHVIVGDYTYRVNTEADSYEFQQLNEAVNHMLDEVGQLRIERYEKELELKSRELRLLRNQIRPHFYLNALTMISNMTYQNQLDDIRLFIDHLSKHLRYSFSINKQLVPLEEEIRLTENYLQLQEIRFPGSVEYEFSVDERVKSIPIMHCMIITLVENAFKHGMSLYARLMLRICCTLEATENGSVCRIVVDDNGPGFDPEYIKAFNDSVRNSLDSDKKSGIGLDNVKRSLAILYPSNQKMYISLNDWNGARIVIEIPVDTGENKSQTEVLLK